MWRYTLAILQALRGRRMPVAAAVLAERFAVSERTIYRDIATLVGQGAVIDGGAGLGYVLRDDFFIPPLAFDAEEAAALMLGLRFVLSRGDATLVEAARSARGKLAAVLPARFDDEASMRSPLLVAPPAPDRAAALAIVREALTRERKLRIAYVDAGGRRTERLVWPVVLGWFDGLETAGAWCERREAFRSFRVDRMAAAVLVDERPPRSRRRLLAEFRALEPEIAL